MDQLRSRDASLWFGLLLVALGVLFLAGQVFHFDLGRYGWPFFVAAPGITLLAIAVSARSLAWLAVPGTIVLVTAALLFVQNLTGLWATWAYAWALPALGGTGLGIAVQGWLTRRRDLARGGFRIMVAGAAIFVVGLVFFEGVLHVSGRDLGLAGRVAGPALLIVAGLLLVAERVRRPASKS